MDLPLRFGVRDMDTRIDRDSIRVTLGHGTAGYAPEVSGNLPTVDLPDADRSREVSLETFDDWVGPFPGTVPTLASGVGAPLQITKSAPTAQTGFYVVSQPVSTDVGAQADVYMTPTVVATGAVTPYNNPEFTGHMVGLVRFGKGVFLFLCEGAAKYIVVTGPATGAGGVRQVLATTNYDWSQPTTYKLMLEPTNDSALVAAMPYGDTEATVLADVALSAVNDLPSTARFGGYAPGASGRAFLIFGVDGAQNTRLDVSQTLLCSTTALGISGVSTGPDMEVEVLPDDAVELVVAELPELATSAWRKLGGAGTVGVGSEVTLSKLSTDDVFSTLRYRRDEPTLGLAPGWLFRVRFKADMTVAGSNHVGAGFRIDDSVVRVDIALLTDFLDRLVGVRTSAGATRLLTTYTQIPGGADWDGYITVMVVVSTARAVVDFYLEDIATPALSLPYAPASLAAPGGDPGVEFGHVAAADIPAGSYGDLDVRQLLYAGHVVDYADHLGVLPPAANPAWAAATVGAAAASLAATGCRIVGNGTAGTPSGLAYYRSEPDLVWKSGGFVEYGFQVHAWNDGIGSPNPVDVIVPAATWMTDTSELAWLIPLVDDQGNKYMHLVSFADVAGLFSGSVASMLEQGRSFAVDWTAYHTYRVSRHYDSPLRVFLDDAAAPSLSLDWADRSLPAGGATPSRINFGCGGVTGADASWKFVRYGVGRGYDFSVLRELAQEDMQAHAFGGGVNIAITASDVDP